MDQEIYIFLDVEVSSQHPTDRGGLSILKEEYILCIESLRTLPWHCVSSNLTWHLGCMGVAYVVTRGLKRAGGHR